MARRHEQHHPVREEGLRRQVRVLDVPLDERQVQPVVQELPLQRPAVLDRHLRAQRGVVGAEAQDQVRQHVRAQRDAAADAQNAQRVPVAQAGLHVFEEVHQVQRLRVELLARFRHQQAPVDPVEEAHAVVVLQLLDGARHRRLRHVQPLRGPRDAPVAVDFQEDLQVPDRHARSPLSISKIAWAL